MGTLKILLISALMLLAAPAMAQEVLFSTFNETSSETINHDNWDKLLGGLVVDRNMILQMARNEASSTSLRMPQPVRIKKGVDINYVPYALIKEEYVDVLFVLQLYIDEMQQVNVSRLNRDEQLAFWLNLRNALVMQTLFNNHPIKKDDVQSFYLGQTADQAHFDTKMLWIEGKLLSVRDIEESIILANWDNPLVLYGLYYGAKGGPFIMNKAFTGANVYRLLEENARSYLNASKTIQVSKKTGIEVPLVFQWHGQLFGHDPARILDHLQLYADKKLGKKLKKAPPGQISYAFDWALNDIPPRVGGIDVSEFMHANTGPGCSSGANSACNFNSLFNQRARALRRE